MNKFPVKKFQDALKIWFNAYKRDLPWRHTNDAYKIWLSEIILQQTTVNQGLPYYNRFLEHFPNIHSFAQASEQNILKLWQGLGYYSRARNMHYTAKEIVSKYGGLFPINYKHLIALKGIGPYTAAAIMSFAYNEAHPVIDGNVMRVIARLFGITNPVDNSEGIKEIQEHVNTVFNVKEPCIHNQAIMEFGALLCKPQKPLCNECFAQTYCMAFKTTLQNVLPIKMPKKTSKDRYFVYIIPYIKEGKTIYTYIKKRTDKDIWKNLYDFILLESETKNSLNTYLDENASLLQTYFYKKDINQFKEKTLFISKQITHKLTHQNIHTFFIIMHCNKIKSNNSLLKIRIRDLNNYPLPKLIENFIEELYKFC